MRRAHKLTVKVELGRKFLQALSAGHGRRVRGLRQVRRVKASRRQLFESLDRPALAPLPDTDHEFAEWRLARVSLDYHIEIDGFYYSIPIN